MAAPLAPLLCLIKQSGRTQPTTLVLLNSSTRQPSTTTHPAITSRTSSNHFNSMPTATPALLPQAASSRAQEVITSFHALSCITRLDLQGVVVDPPLLQAMQGLHALTHLHLSGIQLSALPYQPGSFPEGLRTLSIKLDTDQQPHNWQASFTSLLTELLVQDTITDLTVDDTYGSSTNYISTAQAVFDAFSAAMVGGRQARALRRLCLPHGGLTDGRSRVIKRAAPLLEDLQVDDIYLSERDEDDEVSWRTLRVHNLDLSACRYLPLGGTEPLDIHVSFKLFGCGTASLGTGGNHLTSQHTRPVRLVGSGADGGTFSWHSVGSSDDWVTGLSVLQLSKAPVRKLGISIGSDHDADQLLLALQPLTALTQLSLTPISWYADGPTQNQLLARLSLHVTHVHLGMDHFSRVLATARGHAPKSNFELFCRMAVAASTVPGRRASPLHLSVVGTGTGTEVWEAVEECRARGDMGVVMAEQ